MEAPVLSKKLQKKTLSVKKGPVKGLRNVLAEPRDTYWPVLRNEKGADLEETLKRLLPVLKEPPRAIPWSRLREMKKEERVEAKRKIKEANGTPDKYIRKDINLGINAVTCSLEKNDTCAVLLEANVDPTLLIKHVVLMAQNKGVPILLLLNLKVLTLESMGFACAAISLKKNVEMSSENYFHPLYQQILSISADFPVPKPIIELENSEKDNSEEMEVSMEDSTLEDSSKPFTLPSNIYKYRSGTSERVFIPPSSKTEPCQIIDKGWTDFVPLGEDSETDETIKLTRINKKDGIRYMNLQEIDKSDDENFKKEDAKDFIMFDTKGITQEPDSDSDDDSMDDEEDLSKIRFKVLGSDNLRINKNKIEHDVIKQKKVKYLPLKVKRIQGNVNRKTATKLPKSKKK